MAPPATVPKHVIVLTPIFTLETVVLYITQVEDDVDIVVNKTPFISICILLKG